MNQYRIDFEVISWKSPAAGVRVKVYEQNEKILRLVEFSKEFVEAEWCTKGHIGYILEGRMEIDFNGRIVPFGPGDGIFIPSGDQHAHKANVLTDMLKVILVEDA